MSDGTVLAEVLSGLDGFRLLAATGRGPMGPRARHPPTARVDALSLGAIILREVR